MLYDIKYLVAEGSHLNNYCANCLLSLQLECNVHLNISSTLSQFLKSLKYIFKKSNTFCNNAFCNPHNPIKQTKMDWLFAIHIYYLKQYF